jgi:hypothetical protein
MLMSWKAGRVTELIKLVLLIMGISLLVANLMVPRKPWGHICGGVAVVVFFGLQFLWGWSVGSIVGWLVVTAIFAYNLIDEWKKKAA